MVGYQICFTDRLLLHGCLLSCVYSVLVDNIQKTIDTCTLLVTAINFGGLSISSSNQRCWVQPPTIANFSFFSTSTHTIYLKLL